MNGVFDTPYKMTANSTYLDEIESVITALWKEGIASIIDLHQDVLASVICGEGFPNWMFNMSQLATMDFPEPIIRNGTAPDPATGGWEADVSCSPVGPLSFIGWSEFYMVSVPHWH